jgi:hypothetical protein
MFMSDETEAKCVWATSPEQAIATCQLRLCSVSGHAKAAPAKISLLT